MTPYEVYQEAQSRLSDEGLLDGARLLGPRDEDPPSGDSSSWIRFDLQFVPQVDPDDSLEFGESPEVRQLVQVVVSVN